MTIAIISAEPQRKRDASRLRRKQYRDRQRREKLETVEQADKESDGENA